MERAGLFNPWRSWKVAVLIWCLCSCIVLLPCVYWSFMLTQLFGRNASWGKQTICFSLLLLLSSAYVGAWNNLPHPWKTNVHVPKKPFNWNPGLQPAEGIREFLGFPHQIPTKGSQSPLHSVGSGKVNRIPMWNYEFIFKIYGLNRCPLRHTFCGFSSEIPSTSSRDYFSPSCSLQDPKETSLYTCGLLVSLQLDQASEVNEKDNRMKCRAIAEWCIQVKDLAFLPTSGCCP